MLECVDQAQVEDGTDKPWIDTIQTIKPWTDSADRPQTSFC